MKIIKILFVATFTLVAAFSMCSTQQNAEMSDLAKANIEALASGEETRPGSYDIEEQITDHYYNGSLYKQSKVVNCHVGGSFACSSGNYYRYKQDNGLWAEWIPA